MTNRTQRLLTCHLLMLLMLMGSWLSLWTTPMVVSNAQAEQIFICTLQGIQAATLTSEGELSIGEHEESCPAIRLQAMLGQATPSAPVLPIAHVRQEISSPSIRLLAATTQPIYTYSARAPPLS